MGGFKQGCGISAGILMGCGLTLVAALALALVGMGGCVDYLSRPVPKTAPGQPQSPQGQPQSYTAPRTAR